MTRVSLAITFWALLAMLSINEAAGTLNVFDTPQPGAMALVAGDSVAMIVRDADDHRVVQIAADALAEDINRVTGRRPPIVQMHTASTRPAGRPAIILGSLDRSRIIRQMVENGTLEAADLQGQWESFKFSMLPHALVIVGSDRRGTAYGAFELSRAIGVSPWYWWADVPSRHRDSLYVRGDDARVGPPSVRYRGIFLNDEDWGLHPWAAKTFEPEAADIGPKTYARIFELLLRLKANYCWPAMHPCTKAFNLFPQNKQVADDYAIVMGSSHAEPMLRNNVSEWPQDKKELWDPVNNLPAILEYWEQRVRQNRSFESTWTLGMRGIHDSGMPGGGTLQEKRNRLESIIAAQRNMLARHVDPILSHVPQVFCPYKEVLDIYRAGLKLPDDVTLVWPDDNFGYIRLLPNASEQTRAGRSGVYYHLSYWGRPHDYLWLESQSPALIWHEMSKAYEFGADRLWIANVGDIKPAEAGMTLFLELAWNIRRYGADVFTAFLRNFYVEQFGAQHARAIADLKAEYFRLCAIRKPEHLGWNTVYPNRSVQDGELCHTSGNDETAWLLQRWLDLTRAADDCEATLPPEQRPAYFQLVRYPASAGAAMAEKLIAAEKSRLSNAAGDAPAAAAWAQRSRAALARIERLTDEYNRQLGGKWRGIMDHRPRHLPVFDLPPLEQPATRAATRPSTGPLRAPSTGVIALDAARPSRIIPRSGVRWESIDGLGRRGAVLALFPKLSPPVLHSMEQAKEHAPIAEYDVDLSSLFSPTTSDQRELDVLIEALPTHPITDMHALICGVSINDFDPTIVQFEQSSGENDPLWQQNVLRGAMFGRSRIRFAAADRHVTLKLWGCDPSVVLQRITLSGSDTGAEGATSTYLGPRASNAP